MRKYVFLLLFLGLGGCSEPPHSESSQRVITELPCEWTDKPEEKKKRLTCRYDVLRVVDSKEDYLIDCLWNKETKEVKRLKIRQYNVRVFLDLNDGEMPYYCEYDISWWRYHRRVHGADNGYDLIAWWDRERINFADYTLSLRSLKEIE